MVRIGIFLNDALIHYYESTIIPRIGEIVCISYTADETLKLYKVYSVIHGVIQGEDKAATFNAIQVHVIDSGEANQEVL